MTGVTHLTAEEISALASRVLESVGLSPENAAVIAEALAWADLRGITPQGIAKLPLIVRRISAGGNPADARPEILVDAPALTVIDADHAWGHLAGVDAMKRAIGKARTVGLGVSIVRNTSSASAMGYYASLASERGLIGFAVNNTLPLMPPHGGTSPVLGNQAFAIAAPSGSGPPIVFDSATSATTWTAIDRLPPGQSLPADMALDAAGRPTRNPEEAKAGMLLPAGGHRGYGLALMLEVLTGVLSGGSAIGGEVSSILALDRPQGVSLFMMAIDPEAGPGADAFTRRVGEMADRIRATPVRPGTDPVRLPGERSSASATEREATGVAVPDSVLREIHEILSSHSAE